MAFTPGVDSGAVTAPVFKIDSSGNTVFQQHPTNQEFLFEDKNGTRLVIIDSTGHIVINNDTTIQALDNGGTAQRVFKYDSSNNSNYFTGTTGHMLIVNQNTGDTIATLLENSGLNIQGSDSTGANATIFGVNSAGDTFVQAHSTDNKVEILDSSGAVIAIFAGSNKITTLKGGQIEARTPVSANYTILASELHHCLYRNIKRICRNATSSGSGECRANMDCQG